MKKIILAVLAVLIAVGAWLYFVKGYVWIKRGGAVPTTFIYEAHIRGMHNIRMMVDPFKAARFKLNKIIKQSDLVLGSLNGPEINILAISGGGANGAYAAGVLCGWTNAGNRPQFDIVTGVSTGALIAPAAFLGSSCDHIIRDIYTNISDADIFRQDLVEFFFEGRPSLLDARPLKAVLNRAVTKDIIKAVAREHVKGRRLYMATTNLDARRLVIWDMGAIASSDSPEAENLFRDVMLASASIPVAMPPVMIKVEANGKQYEEMHADGSIATQIIGSLLLVGYDEVKRKKTNVYVIRNGKIADVPGEVSYKVWDIAAAAFSTLMTWQSYNDIYRFATIAKYGRIKFYFTYIPYTFSESRKGEFDLGYMRKLFYRGYREELAEKNWVKSNGRTLVKCTPGE
jgi:hypothetical protein